MSKIKFRMWDFEEEEMIDGDSLAFEEYAPLVDLLNQEGIMQFTGITDIEMQEVYQGDIVEHGFYNEFYTVKWDNDLACFYLHYESCPNGYKKVDYDCEDCDHCLSVEGLAESKIVGNIYKNPELLKASK